MKALDDALAVASFWAASGASRIAGAVSQWRSTGGEKGVQGGFFWPSWVPAGLKEIDASNPILVRSMWLSMPRQDHRDDGAGRRRPFSTYWRPLDSDNAPAHRLIFLDDIESINLFRDYRHAILETSPGNFQGWFVIEESVPPETRLSIQKLICQKFNADAGAGGSMRWTRMPGSINYKPGKFRFATRLVSINNEGRFIEIPEQPAVSSNHAPRGGAVSAPGARPAANIATNIAKLSGSVATVANFIQNWIPRGVDATDSGRDFGAILSLLRRGTSSADIYAALVEVAANRGKARPDYYARLTLEKAEREIAKRHPSSTKGA